MRQESASGPALLSIGLEKDLDKEPAIYDQFAITVPFCRSTARCKCESEALSERPIGCKDCAPVSALAKLKSEAIEQTRRRWVWFSAAQKLDDELNTRLGTLGYLPLEIRLNIFRHVLENYIEEALTSQIFHDPFGYHHFDYYKYEHPVSEEDHDYPSILEWQVMKDQFMERPIEIVEKDRAHGSEDPELYDIFSLRSHNWNWGEPAFAMDIRSSTNDIKLEFDGLFLSTMTFRFQCQKALRHFIKQFSLTQLAQVRSIIIEITACYGCHFEDLEFSYKSWGSVCSLLPSTLRSIRFAPGSNRTLPKLDGRPYRRTWTTDRYSVQKDKRAKQVLEFLSCRVRHAAPEAEITMTERPQRGNIMWDKLDAVVRETDTWSKEYLEWKRGLDCSE